jgi:hypothetical protein
MKPKPLKFAGGDYIKLATKIAMFSKSSVQSYTTENFRIKRAVQASPTNWYTVVDSSGNPVVGSVVEAQMIRVRVAPGKPTTRSSSKKPLKPEVAKIIQPVLRRSARQKAAKKNV